MNPGEEKQKDELVDLFIDSMMSNETKESYSLFDRYMNRSGDTSTQPKESTGK